MNRRMGAIAAITAGLTLLVSRIPAPDPIRLRLALKAMDADGWMGLRALAFEGATAWQRWGFVPDPRAAALAAAALGFGGLAALAIHLWRARPGPIALRRPSIPMSRDRRVDQARALARKGRLNIDVARRTTLSRDAVDLLTMVPRPDRVAARGRTFRRARSRSMVA